MSKVGRQEDEAANDQSIEGDSFDGNGVGAAHQATDGLIDFEFFGANVGVTSPAYPALIR